MVKENAVVDQISPEYSTVYIVILKIALRVALKHRITAK